MEMLKPLMKEKGLTMKQLGAAVGVAEGTISLYAAGKRFPSPETLCAIADALGVSLDMLIRGKEKDRPEGRSIEELIAQYRKLSDEQIDWFIVALQAVKADRQFQAHIRQGKEENQ